MRRAGRCQAHLRPNSASHVSCFRSAGLLAPECKADATTMTLPAIKNGAACIRKETDKEFGGSALSTNKLSTLEHSAGDEAAYYLNN